jgi:hypothetical protein
MNRRNLHKSALALLISGVMTVGSLLIGCGHKEAEPSAKGYYEGPSTDKGASGVKMGGTGDASKSSPPPQ